ncbi:chaplin [Streptantibioticus rubrisoli]|uniref:Chaplin n=1 Tax=Streptantibioticus rubrisoli TaxID=1387313 RepID=A0ABT1P5P5_9ACTN|nr:chaplin [Streptantibioticus rubrisoli]MCQ4040670.1 chaplin [Streptantibioticus rubrisoli]
MKRIIKATALAAASCAVVVGAAGAASAQQGGASANGATVGSPGVLSGNVIQVPINLPVSLCGNSINLIALLNPTAGNACASK